VGRVASRLSKLAREGEVIRLRHKWDGGCMWTLPGTKVGDYIAKRYVVS